MRKLASTAWQQTGSRTRWLDAGWPYRSARAARQHGAMNLGVPIRAATGQPLWSVCFSSFGEVLQPADTFVVMRRRG